MEPPTSRCPGPRSRTAWTSAGESTPEGWRLHREWPMRRSCCRRETPRLSVSHRSSHRKPDGSGSGTVGSTQKMRCTGRSCPGIGHGKSVSIRKTIASSTPCSPRCFACCGTWTTSILTVWQTGRKSCATQLPPPAGHRSRAPEGRPGPLWASRDSVRELPQVLTTLLDLHTVQVLGRMDDHLRLVGRKGDELPIAVRSQHLGREAGPSAALQIELLGKFRCGLIAKSASDPGLGRSPCVMMWK